jgi:hypothetical protein
MEKKWSLIFSALCLALVFSVSSVEAQFDSGSTIFWTEGDREDIFLRASSDNCPAGPADVAPDKNTWITVDSATLNATNAKAAIVFGHAFAENDGTGETNGIATFLSKVGTTPRQRPHNQLVHTKVFLANESGDEHAMMIIALDANKDFDVQYRFGEISGSVDETRLCSWGTRIQLLGYIE